MMSYTIQGKTALVTGANRGLGKALVEALIAKGAKRIYVGGRQLADLSEAVKLAPSVVIPVQLDVVNGAHIRNLTREITELDILINNAGTATGSMFSGEDSLAIANTEMAVNYFGPVNLVHALLPLLRQSPAAAILNISSIAGISSFPILGPYSASKAALHSFTQGLRAELAAAGIFVQGVYPGPMDTRMAEGFEMAKAAPGDVADLIFQGLEQGTEDIFPDAFSQAMYAVFNQNPKQLEQQFASMVG